MKTEKLIIYHNEQFKEIELDPPAKLHYAVSNLGRLASYTYELSDGRILKPGKVDGYHTVHFNIYPEGKLISRQLFVYKLVAQYFITKTSEDREFVIHLDYVRNNDDVRNLRWVTKKERLEHISRSPLVIEARKKLSELKKNGVGSKLTSTKVMMIKKLLANPNRKTRIKMIARQFGVCEMQIYRIKSGENWGHIKI